MGRAKFIALLSLLVFLGLAAAAVGQVRKHSANVIMVMGGKMTRVEQGFQAGLKDAGYNVSYRTVTVTNPQLTARALKRLPFYKPDLIYVSGVFPSFAKFPAKARSTPMILKVDSPSELAAALPGAKTPPANITGIFQDVPFPIQYAAAKRLLNFTRVGYLNKPDDPQSRLDLETLQSFARREGSFSVVRAEVHTASDIGAAVKYLRGQKADLLWIPAEPFTEHYAREIVRYANRYRIPTLAGREDFVLQAGALLAMTGDPFKLGQIAAAQADSILRHEVGKPADVPMEGPIAFYPVVNLRTAHRLGIALPASFALTAKKVARD